MKRPFERRFVGRSNAGLRAQIRDAVNGHLCGPAREQRVLSLAGTVALTAAGRATLASVAADYRAAATVQSCDCEACWAEIRSQEVAS